ncbi:unnamed protein product [Larinioides sclopetarius]|uniref:dual-specificity kinase n=1 Tax=Larinioides sclopetarius TaxID=280406 RepID=A0AAV2BM57_9ARAC
MSASGEALLYNCRSLEHSDNGPVYSHIVSVRNGAKNLGNISKKYSKPSRSMSTCVPSSSYEALRYAVAALNRLDDFNCEKIGAGFFSEVFKVTHRTTGQVMVLKMNTSLSNRANMLREVQLMNRLSHENILRFMGVCVHEGQLHALTEFINGGSLEQLLQNKHIELSWETRIKLSLDIARGMCYLHSRGVFHRDLTSKNVLIKIDEEMTAVVGDFGLAEKIPDPRDRSQRLPIVGSPYWMAPECLKGQWYNEKADVFSYGIILCEIIARIEADPDILPRTENFGVDYVAFSEMCADCPPQFLELAFTCCRINPDSRPSFKEIVHQLEKMLNVISSMSGGSQLFYPPVVYTSCWDDGDNIDSVRAIFAHGWNKLGSPPNKIPQISTTPVKISNSNVPQTPVTPKHIGEAMSICDPHYKPNNSSHNPFASLPRFWKGKKFLEPSVNDIDLAHSMNFDLMSPPKRSMPAPSETPETKKDKSTPSPNKKPGKNLSKSLPSSPVLHRKLPKVQTRFSRLCNGDMSDSPRSVSPCPYSSSTSMSPFDDYSFSVQEQMNDCKLDDACNQLSKSRLETIPTIPCESPAVVNFRTKTPSLCAKLRRSSGESGFFSVGDRSSNCDLSLEIYPTQEDLPSWATDNSAELQLNDSPNDLGRVGCIDGRNSTCDLSLDSYNVHEDMPSWTTDGSIELNDTDDSGQVSSMGGRKRPSSCYSDDSCCCGNHSPSICEVDLELNKEHFGKSKDLFCSLPVCRKPDIQSLAMCDCTCHLCSTDTYCRSNVSCAVEELSSHEEIVQPNLETSKLSDPSLARHHTSTVLSKTCEKGKRIAKCMRTSAD